MKIFKKYAMAATIATLVVFTISGWWDTITHSVEQAIVAWGVDQSAESLSSAPPSRVGDTLTLSTGVVSCTDARDHPFVMLTTRGVRVGGGVEYDIAPIERFLMECKVRAALLKRIEQNEFFSAKIKWSDRIFVENFSPPPGRMVDEGDGVVITPERCWEELTEAGWRASLDACMITALWSSNPNLIKTNLVDYKITFSTQILNFLSIPWATENPLYDATNLYLVAK